ATIGASPRDGEVGTMGGERPAMGGIPAVETAAQRSAAADERRRVRPVAATRATGGSGCAGQRAPPRNSKVSTRGGAAAPRQKKRADLADCPCPFLLVPMPGLELGTFALRMRCSTN